MMFLTILALPTTAFWERPSHAAEIICLKKYGRDILGENRARALELWPSGRIPNKDTCTRALIRGPIIAGDNAKFAELLRANHPFMDDVLLTSPGGTVEEAVKIGRLIRKGLLTTESPVQRPDGRGGYFPTTVTGSTPIVVCSPKVTNDCRCASACFLIWAAGIRRTGDMLGLHRPTTASTTFANLPPDRASVLYRRLLMDISNYLTDMEIPRRFIEIMTDTSSREIRWLTFDEATSLEEIPSVAEWIAPTCGAMSRTEKMTMLTIGVEMLTKNISPRDRMLYDQLSKKSSDIYVCESRKIAKARDAIRDIGD